MPKKINRSTKQRVKTAKGRKTSSTKWLARQLNDPYVKKAERDGYRSRAAYKILEMNDKLNVLKPGVRVVDLGAAPGGWSQVAVEKGCKKVVGLDILPIDPLPGAHFIEMDFNDDTAPEKLMEALSGPADVVMSDIAPNTIGHKQTDHLRMMALVEMAYDFATQVLVPGGTFIAKVFQGGTEADLLKIVKRDFETTKHLKPPSSRKDSSERFLVAQGFRG